MMANRKRISYLSAFMAGVAGALVMALFFWLSRISNISAVNFSEFLGSLFFTPLTLASFWIGFLMHLFVGGFFAMGYEYLFRRFGHTGTKWGGLIGISHWLVGGVLLGLVSQFHPNPTREGYPGYFGLQYGPEGFWIVFLGHAFFGMIVGWICCAIADKKGSWFTPSYPKPIGS